MHNNLLFFFSFSVSISFSVQLVLSMVRGHGNREANSLIRTSGTLVSRLQPPRHLLPICMVPTSQLLVGIPLHIRWWHGSLFLPISIVHFWNTPPHVVYLFFPMLSNLHLLEMHFCAAAACLFSFFSVLQ